MDLAPPNGPESETLAQALRLGRPLQPYQLAEFVLTVIQWKSDETTNSRHKFFYDRVGHLLSCGDDCPSGNEMDQVPDNNNNGWEVSQSPTIRPRRTRPRSPDEPDSPEKRRTPFTACPIKAVPRPDYRKRSIALKSMWGEEDRLTLLRLNACSQGSPPSKRAKLALQLFYGQLMISKGGSPRPIPTTNLDPSLRAQDPRSSTNLEL
eukprot:maker-scaffold1210_size55525-snap-gene-0.16 protein:Tk07917 transcript:maker-scaffold1210_size55525-snap-gene-0.16-mRNA-1 annotation:"50s ribosomal protein l24"